MSITSLGIGSGLDLESLVGDLVRAEIAPASFQLDVQESELRTELSALGTLKAALDNLAKVLEDFDDPSAFLKRKVTSGNKELFTVTGDETATPSSYRVEVQQLAERQRLRSGAFADTETAIGTGTLTFSIGDESFDVVLEEGSNDLVSLRDAINAADDNPGVTASIVTGDDGAYLLLSPEDTGTENVISVSASADSVGLEGLTFDPDDIAGSGFSQENEAKDAIVVIDGITVTSSSNTLSEAIDGVTITLLKAEPDTTADLTVSIDQAAVESRVDSFVFNYNAVIDTLNSLTLYDSESEISGPLIGDSTIRVLETQLRGVLGNPIQGLSGSFDKLSDVGITLDFATGRLRVDETIEGFSGVQTVEEAIEADLAGLAELFASEDGVANQLARLVESYVEDDGLLDTRIDGLEASLEEIETERQELDDRAIAFEAQLRAEFLALDLLVAELSSTSAFLTEQLRLLPGPTDLAGF